MFKYNSGTFIERYMGQILERYSAIVLEKKNTKMFVLEQLLQTFSTVLELFLKHSKLF